MLEWRIFDELQSSRIRKVPSLLDETRRQLESSATLSNMDKISDWRQALFVIHDEEKDKAVFRNIGCNWLISFGSAVCPSPLLNCSAFASHRQSLFRDID
jgi:hypothetical protein